MHRSPATQDFSKPIEIGFARSAPLTALQKCPCKQVFLLHGRICTEVLQRKTFQSRRNRLCRRALRAFAPLTALQKCPCKQAFLLHGRICTEVLQIQDFSRPTESALPTRFARPVSLTASQKCPCKQAFLLHGRICAEVLQRKTFQSRLLLCCNPHGKTGRSDFSYLQK